MNDKIEEILKQPWTLPTAIGLLSFGGGLGVGYFLAKRRIEKQEVYLRYEIPEKLLNDSEGESDIEITVTSDDDDIEIEEVVPPTEIEIIRPPRVVISEEVALTKDILKVSTLDQLRPSMLTHDEADDEEDDYEPDNEPDIVVVQTDEDHDDEWDYEIEISQRNSSQPYILHQEEFFADENNYSQMTLTYYAVDDIMADEDEKPVYNYKNVTGELRFGHGSSNPDTVYIRNDERRAEYEVIRLDALYSVEILGLEIENNERVADLKHSRVSRFRMD